MSTLPAHPPTTSPVMLSVEDTATRLGCSRRRVFGLLREGRLLRAERLGKETQVTIASIELLERAVTGAPEPRRRVIRHRTAPGSGGAAVLAIPID